MTSRDFCYWLQGFLELRSLQEGQRNEMSAEQVDCVRKHLNMVFYHDIDPSFPKEQQQTLTELHATDNVRLNC